MLAMSFKRCIDSEHHVGISSCLQQPRADVELIGAEHQDRVIKFARHLQRPPAAPPADDVADVLRWRLTSAR